MGCYCKKDLTNCFWSAAKRGFVIRELELWLYADGLGLRKFSASSASICYRVDFDQGT